MDLWTCEEFSEADYDERSKYIKTFQKDVYFVGILEYVNKYSEFCFISKCSIIRNCKIEDVLIFSDDNTYNKRFWGNYNAVRKLKKINAQNGDYIKFKIKATYHQEDRYNKEKFFSINNNEDFSILTKVEIAKALPIICDNLNNSVYLEDVFADSIESFKQEVSLLTEKKNDIQVELDEKIKEISQLEEDKTAKLNLLHEEIENERTRLLQELSSYKQKLKNMGILFKNMEDETSAWLPKININLDCNNKSDGNKLAFFDNNILKRASDIRKLMEADNHEISSYTVLSFLLAILSKQLIILAGNPGSGKTSFITKFASVTNSECVFVPVQPGWMDREDLLGFYNPLENLYVPTYFLESLIDLIDKAQNNPDKMYFFCLDEMNLSQVEYYFADFLSELQNGCTIKLYGDDILNKIKQEYYTNSRWFNKKYSSSDYDSFIANATREEIEFYNKIKNVESMIDKYKSKLNIPDNIKFIGTLNHDETTKTLSPKVIDRSYVIKIDRELEKRLDDVDSKIEENCESEEYIINLDNHVNGNDIYEEYANKLDKCNISVGFRIRSAIDNICKILPNIYYEYVRDLVISSMILPKINLSHNDEDASNSLECLGKLCQGRLLSERLYNDMKEYYESDDNKPLTFWRKN